MRKWIVKALFTVIIIIEFFLSVFLCSGEKYSAWPIFIGFIIGDVIILCIIGMITATTSPSNENNKNESYNKWSRFTIEELGGLADKGNVEAWQELVNRFREIERNKPEPPKMSLEEAVNRSLAGENVNIGDVLKSSKEN